MGNHTDGLLGKKIVEILIQEDDPVGVFRLQNIPKKRWGDSEMMEKVMELSHMDQ